MAVTTIVEYRNKETVAVLEELLDQARRGEITVLRSPARSVTRTTGSASLATIERTQFLPWPWYPESSTC
jgi:hypothetical protein